MNIPNLSTAFDVWALSTGNPTKANDDWSALFPEVRAEVKAAPVVHHAIFQCGTVTVDGETFEIFTGERLAESLRLLTNYVTARRIMASNPL